MSKASDFHGKFLLVGGAVRDRMLGLKPKDLDFLFVGDYDVMRQNLLDDGAKIFLEKPEFKTIRCSHPAHGPSDFQSCDDLIENLRQRDFNINAIAMDLRENKWIDYTGKIGGGQAECVKTKRMTTLPGSLIADPIRLIRGLRLSSKLGFQWTPFPVDLSGCDKERVRAELQKLFEQCDTQLIIHQLYRENLLYILDGFKLKPILEVENVQQARV